MGNRAVITTRERKVGLYLHWNGGRDSVEPLLRYCELQGYRPPSDDDYGWARLAQVVGNFFGGSTSVGIGAYTTDAHMDPGDNGIYVIEGWRIVERLRAEPQRGRAPRQARGGGHRLPRGERRGRGPRPVRRREPRDRRPRPRPGPPPHQLALRCRGIARRQGSPHGGRLRPPGPSVGAPAPGLRVGGLSRFEPKRAPEALEEASRRTGGGAALVEWSQKRKPAHHPARSRKEGQ